MSSIESEEGILVPYFIRCDKIEEHMNNWRENIVVDHLCHTPGSLNISDLATGSLAKDEDVDVGSEWQEGPVYLKYKREEWPISREFRNKVSEDEVTKMFKINTVKSGGPEAEHG